MDHVGCTTTLTIPTVGLSHMFETHNHVADGVKYPYIYIFFRKKYDGNERVDIRVCLAREGWYWYLVFCLGTWPLVTNVWPMAFVQTGISTELHLASSCSRHTCTTRQFFNYHLCVSGTVQGRIIYSHLEKRFVSATQKCLGSRGDM